MYGNPITLFNKLHSKHSSDISRAIILFADIICRQSQPLSAFDSNQILRIILAAYGPKHALQFYSQVPFHADHHTYPLLLSKIFPQANATVHARITHTRLVKNGLSSDEFIRNSLVRMYNSFHDIPAAQRIFLLHSSDDPVLWNTMVDGYIKNEMFTEAKNLFDQMYNRDSFTYNIMISGYAAAGDMEAAEEIFSKTPKPFADVVTWNSLLIGYTNVGDVTKARIVFDSMPEKKNRITWNTMLGVYVRCGDYKECLKLFQRMMSCSSPAVKPNKATLVSVLTSSTHLGLLDIGRWVHSYIQTTLSAGTDVLLNTALLTMYTKCGEMCEAKKVFDAMLERNVVTWNCMIMGYGNHGDGQMALAMFSKMEEEKDSCKSVSPNAETLVCLLSSCAHSGLVVDGLRVFNRIVRVHGIRPNDEHFGCLIDLVGRAEMDGDGEYEALVEEMMDMVVTGGDTSTEMVGAVLSAWKRSESNGKGGEMIGKKMVTMEVESDDVGCYVMLSNIYASQGRWDLVEQVRRIISKKGLVKPAGFSKNCSNGPDVF